MATCKEVSRKNYGTNVAVPTENEIKIGAIQRIADATERIADASAKMASDYNSMQKSLTFYKELAESRYYEIEKLKRQLAGTKSVVTRLKSKMEYENRKKNGTL